MKNLLDNDFLFAFDSFEDFAHYVLLIALLSTIFVVAMPYGVVASLLVSFVAFVLGDKLLHAWLQV